MFEKHYKKTFWGNYYDKDDIFAGGKGDYTRDFFGNMHNTEKSSSSGGDVLVLFPLIILGVVFWVVVGIICAVFNILRNILFFLACFFIEPLLVAAVAGSILMIRQAVRYNKHNIEFSNKRRLVLVLFVCAALVLGLFSFTTLGDRLYRYAEDAISYAPGFAAGFYKLQDKAPSDKAIKHLSYYHNSLLRKQYDPSDWFFPGDTFKQRVYNRFVRFYEDILPEYEALSGRNLDSLCREYFLSWVRKYGGVNFYGAGKYAQVCGITLTR